MTTADCGSGRSRFVAYSTLTREPVMAHVDVSRLLTETRKISALGYDNRFVEVLDCGSDGPDAGTVTLALDAARELYRTVFRGGGALSRPGMPAFPLVDPRPAPPDRGAVRAIEDGLSALRDRALAVGHPRLASILDRALSETRAEIAQDDRPDDPARN